VAHGLGAVPEWIIFRDRDNVNDWVVYHVGLGNTNFLKLNSTNASVDEATVFNDTTPTSSVFSLGTSNLANNTAATIAYCFAPKEGYSKFSTYVGNGSSDGVFVYTGFRPSWLMVKKTDGSGVDGWTIVDNKRDTFNVMDQRIQANSSDAEGGDVDLVDFLSNGFKIRYNGQMNNQSGTTYIYMAFAEQPFKFSNAR
jgi:hypothetical protein